jgi:hypothetical protein
VISHGFWTTRFGGDSSVIGRTVRLNGHALTIVGVTPPKFGGVFALLRTDAWVPMAMQPLVRPGSNLLSNPGPGWLQLFARIEPGVSRDAVQRELARTTGQWVVEGSEPADHPDHRYTSAIVSSLSGVPFDMKGRVFGFMALLLGASGLVLLIASLNVAAMLLARAVARRRETAVRLALGATRGRLVRQLLTESLLLYALGAVGGAFVAFYTTPLLARLPLPLNLPLALDFSRASTSTDGCATTAPAPDRGAPPRKTCSSPARWRSHCCCWSRRAFSSARSTEGIAWTSDSTRRTWRSPISASGRRDRTTRERVSSTGR